MSFGLESNRAAVDSAARDWLINDSGLTSKELRFVFSVFPQRNILSLDDILKLTEADLPGLGFSTIAQSHFMTNLAKLRYKRSNAAAHASYVPKQQHHPNMTSAQIKALEAANRDLERKAFGGGGSSGSAFASAGSQIASGAGASASASGAAAAGAGAAAVPKLGLGTAGPMAVSASPAPGLMNGSGAAPRARDELLAEWKSMEGLVFELHTTLEHVGVKEGRLFADPFMADRSLQWRVLPLRRRAVPADASLCEWAFLINPLIQAVDPLTKLVVDDKYDVEFMAQVTGYSGSADLVAYNGAVPVCGDWYVQGTSQAGKLQGVMLRFITKANPANDFLNIRIKYLIGL